jgi:hypothetical protein
MILPNARYISAFRAPQKSRLPSYAEFYAGKIPMPVVQCRVF